MKIIIEWIKKHKLITIVIGLAAFIIPLIIVHVLFKLKSSSWFTAEWSAGDVLSYIAGVEAFLGTVILSTLALWQNEKIHDEHIESLEPILSMKLISISDVLYLVIENTGATEAIDIQISVLNIRNNGNQTDIMLDGLFHTAFDLYPNEIVQGKVALSAENITTQIFPQLKVHVSYTRPDINRQKEYDRTITYNCGYDIKVTADVHYDNTRIESDVSAIARASVRTANYLDGNQVKKSDELNILSRKSLKNDLIEVIQKQDVCPAQNRDDNIAESTISKSPEEYNANT